MHIETFNFAMKTACGWRHFSPVSVLALTLLQLRDAP